MSESPYDYVIAIDFGTASTAWAVRRPDEREAVVVSPVTNRVNIAQKSASDLHFFLQTENEPLSVENSAIGDSIPSRFEDPKHKHHQHYSLYKLPLYERREDAFANTTNYPNYPSVKPLCGGKVVNRLSDLY